MKVRPSADLADAIARGLPLTVAGQIALPSPLAGIVVLVRGGPVPGGLSLAAVLQPRTLLRVPELEGMQTTRRRNGTVVENSFAVTPGLLNQLVVACGAWPLVVPLLNPSTPAYRVPDAAAIGRGLDLFGSVLVNVVEGIYKAAGKEVPDGELVLAPTGLGVETALAGLRRIRKGAAEIASRVPGQQPPGRVYSPPAEGEEEEATGFADVGGQAEAVSHLEAVCQAIKEPESYRRWGVRPPRGVLLYGPPGTGKTLLARALAKESGARFIHVRATDVVSKWYGEAERKLQEAFDWARREQPTVLFFDEIDALGRSREFAHEATHRLVSTFLENLDGLQLSEGVIVVAATNRPESVDPALTRPGRFDRLVEVPLPDPAARRAIFDIHMRRAERQAGRQLFEPFEVDAWDRVLDASDGQSGADIAEAVRRVLETRVRGGGRGRIAPDELLAQTFSVRRPF